MSLWVARETESVSTGGPGFWRKETLLAAFCAGIGERRYRRSVILAQHPPCSTDGPGFWRAAVPVLPTLPVFRAAIYLLFYLV